MFPMSSFSLINKKGYISNRRQKKNLYFFLLLLPLGFFAVLCFALAAAEDVDGVAFFTTGFFSAFFLVTFLFSGCRFGFAAADLAGTFAATLGAAFAAAAAAAAAAFAAAFADVPLVALDVGAFVWTPLPRAVAAATFANTVAAAAAGAWSLPPPRLSFVLDLPLAAGIGVVATRPFRVGSTACLGGAFSHSESLLGFLLLRRLSPFARRTDCPITSAQKPLRSPPLVSASAGLMLYPVIFVRPAFFMKFDTPSLVPFGVLAYIWLISSSNEDASGDCCAFVKGFFFVMTGRLRGLEVGSRNK
ncbi:uncharacterized protein Tco025E_00114 [Trypanosoma conorhini]|uniref:Uncharacterized protein n=1 Tax=Trypanosoma conorhini TaxID=83891 RepID=A0A422QCL6_9TRYP|nr:uncharacterized protein Tco025E_00114 [Trypanosoma conorhini]RNF27730.1 hypothetical protein Tco025E_00114 [Trypanosoma conorhini]